MSGRDELVGGVIGGLTATDRARLARGITIGALVGAAIAGTLLRARRARRRPRPIARVEATPAPALDVGGGTGDDLDAAVAAGIDPADEGARDAEGGLNAGEPATDLADPGPNGDAADDGPNGTSAG